MRYLTSGVMISSIDGVGRGRKQTPLLSSSSQQYNIIIQHAIYTMSSDDSAIKRDLNEIEDIFSSINILPFAKRLYESSKQTITTKQKKSISRKRKPDRSSSSSSNSNNDNNDRQSSRQVHQRTSQVSSAEKENDDGRSSNSSSTTSSTTKRDGKRVYSCIYFVLLRLFIVLYSYKYSFIIVVVIFKIQHRHGS